MSPQRISVGGEAVYLTGYRRIARERFPHHGGHKFFDESPGTYFHTRLIDFVCPECDMAYRQFNATPGTEKYDLRELGPTNHSSQQPPATPQ